MEKIKLLEKFLCGETSPEETEQVIAYLVNDQSDFTPLQEALSNYQENSTALGDVETRDRLLLQLRQQLYPHLAGKLNYTIAKEGGKVTANNRSNETNAGGMMVTMQPEKKRWKWWIGTAAAVMVLFAAAWFLEEQRYDKAVVKPALVWQPVENRTNSVRRYHLPDGSTLWLHPYSCLHYVADFEQSPERIVSLEGEGFFDVVHNSARPFIIQTGHIQTKVLGTAFNMEAYGNENTIRISLVRGKVAVTNTAASDRTAYTAQLTAGHILVYNKQQQTRSIDTLMETNSSQWTDGTMVLRNIPVADALQRVAKRYGLQLVYTKNIDLEGKNVNGVFKEQTLDEMLHIILFVSGYQYRLTGKMIEIYKK